MSHRHWAWIAAGLAGWAVLVVFWATSPTHCRAPDVHGDVVCGEAGASR